MRRIACLVFVILVFATTLCLASGPGNGPKEPMLLAKGKGSNACLEKCEKQKEQCFEQYKQSDVTHGTYITPEGHKVCWGGYHDCKKNCPSK